MKTPVKAKFTKQSLSASLLTAALIFSNATHTANAAIDKNTFSNFSIIHADKLDFKAKSSELIGDVKIKFGAFTVSAPRVLVDNNKDNSPEVIRFVENVNLKSDDLTITAKTVEIDFKNNLFRAYGEPDVVSTWNKKGGDRTVITSNYQDYNLVTGLATAKSEGKPVEVISSERTITAKKVKLKNDLKSKKQGVESINFSGDVILVEKDKRVEANDLFFWIAGELIKAQDNVKILAYTKDRDPIYLFADIVSIEQDKDILSASMNSFNKTVYMYSKDFLGRGRQAFVERINRQPDKAVFTGNAYAQFQDKSIEGEEIFFDFGKKQISSLAGRPTTSIYSSKKSKKSKKTKRSKKTKKASK